MTHVHVEDVAEAAVHLLFAERVIGRAFNVADEAPIAWGELMAHLERELGLEEKDPLSLSPWKARWLGRLAHAMPSRARRTNDALARRWRELCDEQRLVPALAPRIDASAYDYWSADHVYATDALRQTGFVPRHPDVRRGLTDTIAWYRRERWLP